MLTGEIGFDFGEKSELKETAFDDGTNVFVHFKIAVKDYAKVFGGGADIGEEGVRGIVGSESVMVKYYDFSFILVECQEVIAHPRLDVMEAVKQWLEGVDGVWAYR